MPCVARNWENIGCIEFLAHSYLSMFEHRAIWEVVPYPTMFDEDRKQNELDGFRKIAFYLIIATVTLLSTMSARCGEFRRTMHTRCNTSSKMFQRVPLGTALRKNRQKNPLQVRDCDFQGDY